MAEAAGDFLAIRANSSLGSGSGKVIQYQARFIRGPQTLDEW